MESPSPPPRDFKYDIAFSLLSSDSRLAESLADQLAPLSCFIFTKRQRELVGRNGVEAFAQVFRRDARLAVVLFRAGYGETDYTDLEVRGIQDRGMETRWESVILIKLDETSAPAWFPSRNIWLDLDRYPISEAVGAIRLRAEELGASARIETPSEYLARLARRRDDQGARDQRLKSVQGVADVATEVKRLTADLRRTIDESAEALAKVGPFMPQESDGITIATRAGSVIVHWRLAYSNTLSEAGLYVSLHDGYVSAGGHTPAREPQMLSDISYQPFLDQAWTWCWRPDDGSSPLSTDELRDLILRSLFDVIVGTARS